MKHIQIRVFGKVQGVWFRKNTEAKALELGVKGIVMNEPDGSVYIEAEAEDKVLEEFIHFCKEGPEHAKVQHIVLTEEEMKNYSEFRIIH